MPKFTIQEFHPGADGSDVLLTGTVAVQVGEFDDAPKLTGYDKERKEGTVEGIIVAPCKIRTTFRLRKGDKGPFVEFGNLRIPGNATLVADALQLWEAAKVGA